MKRAVVALAASIAVVLAGAGPVAAHDRPAGAVGAESTAASVTVPVQDVASITEADIDAAFAELSASDLPRTTKVGGGVLWTTFVLEGVDFTFTQALGASAGDGVVPHLGGGVDIRGLYVSFNTLEQQMIAAGATAALAVAICLIPAVGQAVCAVVSVVIAVATTFVVRNGICGSGKALRVYPFSRTARCV